MMHDGGSDAESRNLWEMLGGLKANVEQLIVGQQRLEQGLRETNERIERGLKETNERTDQGLKETNERTERGLKETNNRIDRLLYAVIALSGGVIALLVLRVLEG